MVGDGPQWGVGYQDAQDELTGEVPEGQSVAEVGTVGKDAGAVDEDGGRLGAKDAFGGHAKSRGLDRGRWRRAAC